MVGGQVSPAGSTHSGGLACSPVTVGGGAGAGRAGDGVGPWRVPGRCTVPGRTRASAAPLPAKAGAGLLKTSRTRPASLFPRAHGTPAAPGPATITMWECMEARVHNRTRAGRHAHAQPVCQRDGGPGGQQVALHQLQRGARPVALARGGVVQPGVQRRDGACGSKRDVQQQSVTRVGAWQGSVQPGFERRAGLQQQNNRRAGIRDHSRAAHGGRVGGRLSSGRAGRAGS